MRDGIGDVKENDMVIDVPLKYVLCRPTLTQFKGAWGVALKESFDHFKHDDVPGIALALMLSKASETTNRWKPWVNVLPKQFDGALYFEQRLLDLLPVFRISFFFCCFLFFHELWLNINRYHCKVQLEKVLNRRNLHSTKHRKLFFIFIFIFL